MEVVKFLFLILALSTESSTQQVLPRQELILLQITENVTKCETNLVKNYTILSTFVGYASSNLKAISIAPDLSKTLDETLIKIKELSTLKNHREFFNLTGYSVCDYLSIRMSFLDLGMRHFHTIIHEMQGNFSILHEKLSEISKGYEINLKTLAMNWSRERMIVLTIRHMLRTFQEIFGYIKELKASLKYYEDFHTFIIRLQCKTSSNSSFADAGNKIEEGLKECEVQLKKTEVIAKEKVQVAMKTVSSSSIIIKNVAPSDSKVCLDKIDFYLDKFLTVFDYPINASWPRIPDVTGKMYVIPKAGKLRASAEKKERYENIYENHYENRTILEDAQENCLSLKVTRKVRALNPIFDDAMTATTTVVNQFTECMRRLNDSITQVTKTIDEFYLPCGSTRAYDGVNDPYAPKYDGVAAGTHVDGTIAYIAHGSNNETRSTGRLCIESRGVYIGILYTLFLDTNSSFYLIDHPKLQFIPTNSTHMMTLPGLLMINQGTPQYTFAYGRMFNGSNVMVGKVHAGNGVFGFYYTTPDGNETIVTTGYEVVVCN